MSAVPVVADINDEELVKEMLWDMHFDTVCEFIGFVPEHLERNYMLSVSDMILRVV